MFVSREVIFLVGSEEEQSQTTSRQDILDSISRLEAAIWAHSYQTASDRPE